MTDKIPYSSLFIELDALMDTRFATLLTMSDEDISAALESGYYTRDIDEFPNVNNALFKQLYANRTKDILEQATITPLANMLKEFSAATIKNSLATPHQLKPKVIVNVYPYKLDTEEQEVIANSVKAITLGLADVEVVYMTYEDITPMYIKREISIIVLYEYYQWLEVHSLNGNIKKHTNPDVSMFGPAIYFKPKPVNLKADDNPFEAMEELAKMFIKLKLLPIEHFSLGLKLVKQHI